MQTLNQRNDNNERTGMIVKRVSVPIGLEELMEGLSREVILRKPKDMYLFASEYFSKLVNLREKSNKYKAHPVHTVQSITKLKNMDVPPLKKISPTRPVKHLSRQLSIQGKSPKLHRPIQAEPATKRNVTSKSIERKTSTDRKDSVARVNSKTLPPRDLSKSSNTKGGTSTGTSSVQSTPRDKRRPSVTRKVQSFVITSDDQNKALEENKKTPRQPKRTKSEKIKTALISPTVIGENVVAPDGTIAAGKRILKENEKNQMLDSDILEESTKLSSINSQVKMHDVQQPENELNKHITSNIDLDNKSNVLINKTTDKSLDSDILAHSTNVAEVSKNMAEDNKLEIETKINEKDNRVYKKDNNVDTELEATRKLQNETSIVDKAVEKLDITNQNSEFTDKNDSEVIGTSVKDILVNIPTKDLSEADNNQDIERMSQDALDLVQNIKSDTSEVDSTNTSKLPIENTDKFVDDINVKGEDKQSQEEIVDISNSTIKKKDQFAAENINRTGEKKDLSNNTNKTSEADVANMINTNLNNVNNIALESKLGTQEIGTDNNDSLRITDKSISPENTILNTSEVNIAESKTLENNYVNEGNQSIENEGKKYSVVQEEAEEKSNDKTLDKVIKETQPMSSDIIDNNKSETLPTLVTSVLGSSVSDNFSTETPRSDGSNRLQKGQDHVETLGQQPIGLSTNDEINDFKKKAVDVREGNLNSVQSGKNDEAVSNNEQSQLLERTDSLKLDNLNDKVTIKMENLGQSDDLLTVSILDRIDADEEKKNSKVDDDTKTSRSMENIDPANSTNNIPQEENRFFRKNEELVSKKDDKTKISIKDSGGESRGADGHETFVKDNNTKDDSNDTNLNTEQDAQSKITQHNINYELSKNHPGVINSPVKHFLTSFINNEQLNVFKSKEKQEDNNLINKKTALNSNESFKDTLPVEDLNAYGASSLTFSSVKDLLDFDPSNTLNTANQMQSAKGQKSVTKEVNPEITTNIPNLPDKTGSTDSSKENHIEEKVDEQLLNVKKLDNAATIQTENEGTHNENTAEKNSNQIEAALQKTESVKNISKLITSQKEPAEDQISLVKKVTSDQVDNEPVELKPVTKSLSESEMPFSGSSPAKEGEKESTVLHNPSILRELPENLSETTIVSKMEQTTFPKEDSSLDIDNNVLKSENSKNFIKKSNDSVNHINTEIENPNKMEIDEIKQEITPEQMTSSQNVKNLEVSTEDTSIKSDKMEDSEKISNLKITELNEIASGIDVIQNIMKSKISVKKPGVLDSSVSQYLHSFLSNEQSNVFQNIPLEQNKSASLIKNQKSKEDAVVNTYKNNIESKLTRGKASKPLSIKKERSRSQENILSVERKITETSTKNSKMRRVRSVGLIKSVENEHRSKIPTSARRSAGRRPLVRQLETDSKDIEEKLSNKNKLNNIIQGISPRGSKESQERSSQDMTDQTGERFKEADANKIGDKPNEDIIKSLPPKDTNKIVLKDVVTKEDVLIAKTILKGIEGAGKHIQLIEQKTSPNVSNTSETDNNGDKNIIVTKDNVNENDISTNIMGTNKVSLTDKKEDILAPKEDQTHENQPENLTKLDRSETPFGSKNLLENLIEKTDVAGTTIENITDTDDMSGNIERKSDLNSLKIESFLEPNRMKPTSKEIQDNQQEKSQSPKHSKEGDSPTDDTNKINENVETIQERDDRSESKRDIGGVMDHTENDSGVDPPFANLNETETLEHFRGTEDIPINAKSDVNIINDDTIPNEFVVKEMHEIQSKNVSKSDKVPTGPENHLVDNLQDKTPVADKPVGVAGKVDIIGPVDLNRVDSKNIKDMQSKNNGPDLPEKVLLDDHLKKIPMADKTVASVAGTDDISVDSVNGQKKDISDLDGVEPISKEIHEIRSNYNESEVDSKISLSDNLLERPLKANKSVESIADRAGISVESDREVISSNDNSSVDQIESVLKETQDISFKNMSKHVGSEVSKDSKEPLLENPTVEPHVIGKKDNFNVGDVILGDRNSKSDGDSEKMDGISDPYLAESVSKEILESPAGNLIKSDESEKLKNSKERLREPNETNGSSEIVSEIGLEDKNIKSDIDINYESKHVLDGDSVKIVPKGLDKHLPDNLTEHKPEAASDPEEGSFNNLIEMNDVAETADNATAKGNVAGDLHNKIDGEKENNIHYDRGESISEETLSRNLLQNSLEECAEKPTEDNTSAVANNNKADEAATTIQKTWKGFHQRKDLKHKTIDGGSEYIKRQEAIPGIQKLKEQSNAAVKIQSSWRGYVTRKIIDNSAKTNGQLNSKHEKGIIKIQAVVRGYLDRLKYKKLKDRNPSLSNEVKKPSNTNLHLGKISSDKETEVMIDEDNDNPLELCESTKESNERQNGNVKSPSIETKNIEKLRSKRSLSVDENNSVNTDETTSDKKEDTIITNLNEDVPLETSSVENLDQDIIENQPEQEDNVSKLKETTTINDNVTRMETVPSDKEKDQNIVVQHDGKQLDSSSSNNSDNKEVKTQITNEEIDNNKLNESIENISNNLAADKKVEVGIEKIDDNINLIITASKHTKDDQEEKHDQLLNKNLNQDNLANDISHRKKSADNISQEKMYEKSITNIKDHKYEENSTDHSLTNKETESKSNNLNTSNVLEKSADKELENENTGDKKSENGNNDKNNSTYSNINLIKSSIQDKYPYQETNNSEDYSKNNTLANESLENLNDDKLKTNDSFNKQIEQYDKHLDEDKIEQNILKPNSDDNMKNLEDLKGSDAPSILKYKNDKKKLIDNKTESIDNNKQIEEAVGDANESELLLKKIVKETPEKRKEKQKGNLEKQGESNSSIDMIVKNENQGKEITEHMHPKEKTINDEVTIAANTANLEESTSEEKENPKQENNVQEAERLQKDIVFDKNMGNDQSNQNNSNNDTVIRNEPVTIQSDEKASSAPGVKRVVDLNVKDNIAYSDVKENQSSNKEKPDFYRSNTVLEPVIVKKAISHLGDTSKNSSIETPLIDENIGQNKKDDNNNTQSKEETELESEVRSAINQIINGDNHNKSPFEVEIKSAVKNIMENNVDSSENHEKEKEENNDEETTNVHAILDKLPPVPSKEIPDHILREDIHVNKHTLGNNIEFGAQDTLTSEASVKLDAITKNFNESNQSDTSNEEVNSEIPNGKKQVVDQSTTNKNDFILPVTPEKVSDKKMFNNNEELPNSEINVDDVSSVDSIDSVITVVPNVNYDALNKKEHVGSDQNVIPSRSLSMDITKHNENKEGLSKNILKKSLSTDALKGHVDLIDHVQNTLLDQISGKPVDSASKFDIEQLRQELHEAASLYKSEEEDPHFSTRDDELLEYLNDFEPEDENDYDSKIISTPNRELPDIEEEVDSCNDDNETTRKAASDKETSEFCKIPVNVATGAEKLIDNKPLEDHVEILNLEKLKHGHNEIVINNDKIQINSSDSINTTEKSDQKLLHSSELHDMVIPMSMASTNRSALVGSGKLKHTSEFHDTLVVPLPSGSDVNIKNEAKDMLGKDQPSKPTKTEAVDNGNQTATQQSPAGAPVVTYRRSSQDGVAVAEAQASLRDTSPAKPNSVESFTHQSPSPRFVKQAMESEHKNNKRNNAIRNNISTSGKNMEAEAATKIQAGFRGYQVRKQLKTKNATEKSNDRHSLRRKSSGRKNANTDLAEKSAVKIQAGVRGFLVRRRQKKQLSSSASA